MYVISNQNNLDRNENVLEDALNGSKPEFKQPIIDAFTKRKAFYVCKKKPNIPENVLQFESDIKNLFNQFSCNIEPFTLKNVQFTIRKFIGYFKKLLDDVNKNENVIAFYIFL